jgi:hypothetical protein
VHQRRIDPQSFGRPQDDHVVSQRTAAHRAVGGLFARRGVTRIRWLSARRGLQFLQDIAEVQDTVCVDEREDRTIGVKGQLGESARKRLTSVDALNRIPLAEEHDDRPHGGRQRDPVDDAACCGQWVAGHASTFSLARTARAR